MQKFLSKYGTAAHLAFLAVAPLFLCPFCPAEVCATVLLWLSLLVAVWSFLEPSRRAGEMLHDARSRVARAVIRDPVFWVLVALMILSAIRWANAGIRLAYDAEQSIWFMHEQPLKFFPGCVKDSGYLPFATMLALTVLFTGCRHSLGKKARISFLFSCAFFSTLSAVVSSTFVAFGYAPAVDLATCSLKTASYSGSAFGLYFLGGLVALIGAFDCRWSKWLLGASFSACGSLIGLYFFAPTPVILLYLGAGVLILVISCGYAHLRINRSVPFKCWALLLMGLSLPVLCVMGFASDTLNASRIALFKEGFVLFDESFLRVRTILSTIAAQAWMEHPWVGTGLGSFALDIRFHATADDWKLLLPGQCSALNGFWQLLAERGIVGALSFALVLVSVFYTWIRRAWRAAWLRVFVPVCVLGLLTVIVLAVESLMDASFLRTDVMLAAGAFLALACSALPDPRKEEAARTDKSD